MSETLHPCPVCGTWHPTPNTLHPPCLCGHPWTTHNDNGGRLKHAYCTIWSGPPDHPLRPWQQCPCADYQPTTREGA